MVQNPVCLRLSPRPASSSGSSTENEKETAVPGTERFLQPEIQHDFTIVYVLILKGRLLCLHLPPKYHRACALRTVPAVKSKRSIRQTSLVNICAFYAKYVRSELCKDY